MPRKTKLKSSRSTRRDTSGFQLKTTSVSELQEKSQLDELILKPSPEHISDKYEHVDPARGKVAIFYNIIDSDKKYVEDLINKLENCGYIINKDDIIHCKGRKAVEAGIAKIKEDIKITNSDTEQENVSCLLLFFFGQVKRDDVFQMCDDNSKIPTSDIWSEFTSYNCPELKNIPKAFIFNGRKLPQLTATDNSKRKSDLYKYDIPAEADILLVFKITEGVDNFFLRQLTENITTLGEKEDLTTLVTLTEDDFTRPIIVSTLTRKFFISHNEHRHYHLEHHEKTKEIHKIITHIKANLKT